MNAPKQWNTAAANPAFDSAFPSLGGGGGGSQQPEPANEANAAKNAKKKQKNAAKKELQNMAMNRK